MIEGFVILSLFFVVNKVVYRLVNDFLACARNKLIVCNGHEEQILARLAEAYHNDVDVHVFTNRRGRRVDVLFIHKLGDGILVHEVHRRDLIFVDVADASPRLLFKVEERRHVLGIAENVHHEPV